MKVYGDLGGVPVDMQLAQGTMFLVVHLEIMVVALLFDPLTMVMWTAIREIHGPELCNNLLYDLLFH